MNNKGFDTEIKEGKRFQFGENWINFIKHLDENGIDSAKESMCKLMEESLFPSKTFLDIGSGSGLSSLVARKMGAIVTSIDYDPDSVTSTKMLKNKYFPNDIKWKIEEGSVLDTNYLNNLGQFDIVYSWGVLHHTGNMWDALNNVDQLVKKNGYLFIALYSDQSYKSRIWWRVKKMYCSSRPGKWLVKGIFYPLFFLTELVFSIKSKENRFRSYKKRRGMSMVHDWKDWLGGFPFEVAKIEEVFSFYKARGFSLYNIKTTTSQGCNEFVFIRNV